MRAGSRLVLVASVVCIAGLYAALLYRRHTVKDAGTHLSSSISLPGRQEPPPLVPQEAALGVVDIPTQEVSRGKSDAPKGGPETKHLAVPALPGVKGFFIPPHLSESFTNFALALAAEHVDLSWAPDMERRLNEAIQSRPEFRGLRVEIVCRTTSCGLLFVPSAEGEVSLLRSSVNEFKNWAANELGFSQKGLFSPPPGSGNDFLLLRLTAAQSQVQVHPATAAAMASAVTPAPPPPPTSGNYPSASTDMRTIAASRLADDQVDRSPPVVALENNIQGEASRFLGASANQVHVDCRVSRCSVVIRLESGASIDANNAGARIANAFGLTFESSQQRTGPYDRSIVIFLKR
jgi:hypothetical protein